MKASADAKSSRKQIGTIVQQRTKAASGAGGRPESTGAPPFHSSVVKEAKRPFCVNGAEVGRRRTWRRWKGEAPPFPIPESIQTEPAVTQNFRI